MAIYSERNKKDSSELKYDLIPSKAKNQIIHIWRDYFSSAQSVMLMSQKDLMWSEFENHICRVHGYLSLNFGEFTKRGKQELCEGYFSRLHEVDKVLDLIEVSFTVIKSILEVGKTFKFNFTYQNVVSRVNLVFKENNLGYNCEAGVIHKIENKLLDNGLIVESIQLTNNPIFKNANEEFLSSLSHLRAERYKAAINEALKAFESTLKIICHECNWEYNPDKDGSSQLIKICLEKELIPSYLQSHFTGIRTTLESGTPTIRNKRSGHGQGVEEIVVPNSLATYAIYNAGSAINYIIELFNDKKANS